MVQGVNYTLDELVVCLMAREFKGEILAGWATYSSALAAALAKAYHDPDLILISGINLLDSSLGPSHSLAEFNVYRRAREAGGYRLPMLELFAYINAGQFRIWVSPAQIDMYGNINISCIGDWERPKAQLVGARGVPDDCVNVPMHYYLTRHSTRSLVPRVDFISGPGYGEAQETGLNRHGYPRLLITNLGVFDFDPATHRMRVRSCHPGVNIAEIQANTGFELIIPDQVPTSVPPTATELELLRRLDPLGVRKLEYLGGDELTQHLAFVRSQEAAAFAQMD